MKILLSILCLTLVTYGSAQNNFDFKKFTETMCSSEFHGRGYVNSGDSIAAEYIADQMKLLGIDSIQSGYFQPFRLSVNTFPDSCSIQINNRLLEPGLEYIVGPASNGTYTGINCERAKTFDPKHIKVLNMKELIEEDRTATERIKYDKGTIYIIDNNVTGEGNASYVHSLAENISKYYDVIELVNTKFTWSVRSASYDGLYIQMKKSTFDTLNSARMNIKINVHNVQLPDYTSRNVIGQVKAKKKAKGTIMLTAHYDHLGRMGSETYFPGANDNASGVAMLLHLGQKLKAKPLRNYDVMCIAFAAEEIGLLGSKYLSEHPLFPLDAIKFQLNLDIMGSGEAGITAVNGLEFKREFKKLSRVNKRLKSVPSVKARGRAANSDHHFFTEKGVKGFFIYTRGNNQNYHDIHDTYENLSFNSFENLSELFTTFLRRL